MDAFDLAFNAFGAFQQFIVLGAGLVFAALGAFFIYDHSTWKKKARKVRATVVGLLESTDSEGAKSYYPVVEYTGPDGSVVRAECEVGSNSYLEKEPGTKVEIFINPDTPDKFRFSKNIFLIVGIIFAAIGLGTCAFALIYFRITFYTPIVLAGLALWGATKFKSVIKPRDQWETPAQFKERIASMSTTTKRESLPMLDKAEVKQRVEKNRKMFLRWGWIGLLMGGGLCYGGYYTSQNLNDMLSNGTRVQGHVVSMESSKTDDGYVYHPVVEFTDYARTKQSFRDNVGSNPPSYSVGDEVTVIYKEDGQGRPMIDKGAWNWLLPGVLWGFGGLIVYGIAMEYRRISRVNMRR